MIKKLLKENSPYLIFMCLFESILSIICTLAFVYSDSLNYSDSLVFQSIGIEKLIESMYSSTWWSLILLLLAFITILTLTSIIYKKMEYQFISICLWIEMLILGINFNKPFIDNISIIGLFVPIILINIIAYNEQKKIITKKIRKK